MATTQAQTAPEICISNVPDEVCMLVMEILANDDPAAFLAVSGTSKRFRSLSLADDERLFGIACNCAGAWTKEQKGSVSHKKWFLDHVRYVRHWTAAQGYITHKAHNAGVVALHVPPRRRFYSFQNGPQDLDSNLLVTASSSPENKIQVWRIASNGFKNVNTLPLSTLFKSWGAVAFAADNSAVAIAQERHVIVYDLLLQSPRFTVSDSTSTITHVHIDGDVFATASYDRFVRVYSLSSGQLLWSCQQARPSTVWSVCVIAKLGVVVSGYDDGEVVRDCYTQSSAFSASANSLLLGDQDGVERHTDTAISMHYMREAVQQQSHNTHLVVSGSYDFSVRVWNLNTGRLMYNLQGHQSPVMCLASFRSLLASGGRDAFINLWDTTTGLRVAQLAVNPTPQPQPNPVDLNLKALYMNSSSIVFGKLNGVVGIISAEDSNTIEFRETVRENAQCVVM